jgi:glycosyltransferase involved in cell wall biosynthesis
MRMRLLHVVDSDQRRGAETFAAELVLQIGRRGVDQHVVMLASPSNDGVDLGVHTSVLRSGGPTVPFLKLDLRILLGLSQVIRSTRPDVIQAHGGDTLKYTAAATLGHRTRLVQRFIGSPPEWVRTGPRRLAYAFILSRASRIIAVSESVRSDVIDIFGVAADRVVVIPSGSDARRTTPSVDRDSVRENLHIPPEAPVLISLGALTWEKDPLAHLEVAASVLRSYPECRHLIVGDGPLRPIVEARVHELGIDKRVMMLGYRHDVGNLLAASDVMLLASRVDGMEGMPAAVIEAGFAGVPVVAYSLAGLGEVIVDGVTGCLVRPGDLNGLVSAVGRLLGDAKLRETMGNSARQRTLPNYEIGIIAPKYFALYDELLQDALS